MKVREEAIEKDEPKHYPIAFNPRIARHKSKQVNSLENDDNML